MSRSIDDIQVCFAGSDWSVLLFFRAVYAAASPAGNGWLHYVEGDVRPEIARKYLEKSRLTEGIIDYWDYVQGRIMKIRLLPRPDGKIDPEFPDSKDYGGAPVVTRLAVEAELLRLMEEA